MLQKAISHSTPNHYCFSNFCIDEWFMFSTQLSLFLSYVLIQNFTTDKRECIYAISFKIITLSYNFCIRFFHKCFIIKLFVTKGSRPTSTMDESLPLPVNCKTQSVTNQEKQDSLSAICLCD